MIEAIELTKKYHGVTALDTLNLKIEPGEIFCLLGANGAGKTTTIHLFLGFITPTSGRAIIDGLEVHRHALATRRLLAYIPEQVNLYPHLTGLENLRYFAELAGRRKVTRNQLLVLLERVNLSPHASARKVATYSKGMRQKIGIAIALAKEAKALLLDEPLSGLERQRCFVRQAEDFKRTWDSLLADRLTRAERLTVADYQALPSFRYREEPSDAIARRVAPALLAIVAAATLLFLGAVRRLSRFTLHE